MYQSNCPDNNQTIIKIAHLQNRFGSPIYFEDRFSNMDRSNLRTEFIEFNNDKHKSDRYEFKRQRFLKLLSHKKLHWHTTNENYDLNVDISRIYRKDNSEYLAFMRIQPNGFRAERLIPAGVEIVFHVLMGTVLFSNKKRPRTMGRGTSATVASGSSYSIRCQSKDQPSILIFKVYKINKRS